MAGKAAIVLSADAPPIRPVMNAVATLTANAAGVAGAVDAARNGLGQHVNVRYAPARRLVTHVDPASSMQTSPQQHAHAPTPTRGRRVSRQYVLETAPSMARAYSPPTCVLASAYVLTGGVATIAPSQRARTVAQTTVIAQTTGHVYVPQGGVGLSVRPRYVQGMQ